MKKKIILSLLLVITAFSMVILPTRADSGWDSSYDSGGSWDSGGSDWGGSRWDNDYDYSSMKELTFTETIYVLAHTILYLCSIILFIYICCKTLEKVIQKSTKSISSNNYYDISDEKIHNIDPDLKLEEFKKYAFNVYKDVQVAWMNFDTETIRKLATDEIYNMYSSQLETLKLKNQKNIMKDIEYVDCKVIDIKKAKGVVSVQVYLRVKCLDYVINEKTNKTVRGKENRRIDIEYELTFVKSETDNKDIEVCPNCNAEVKITSSATCPYCNSVLVKDASKYVMSKKTCIRQGFE